MEWNDKTPSKYIMLNLIFSVMVFLLVWGMLFLILLDNRGIYSIDERALMLLVLAPSLFIWTYLIKKDLERHKMRRNEMEE